MTPNNLPFAVTRIRPRRRRGSARNAAITRAPGDDRRRAGGIGKTTVALAVAERMMASYEHGIWLVDLAPLNDPRLVPSAIDGNDGDALCHIVRRDMIYLKQVMLEATSANNLETLPRCSKH